MTDSHGRNMAAELVSNLSQRARRQVLAGVIDVTGRAAYEALHLWPLWARDSQIAPPGDWSVWLLMAGRRLRQDAHRRRVGTRPRRVGRVGARRGSSPGLRRTCAT